jgi:hypothetical protein
MGDATPALAPLFGVLTSDHAEALLVGQDGSDLVFRTRRSAARLGLRGPALNLRGGAWHAGDTVHIVAELLGPRLTLTSVNSHGRRTGTMLVSPSLGWSCWLPWTLSFGSEVPWFNALWLLVVLLPAAYWGGRVHWLEPRGRTSWWLGVAITLALGLFLVPALLGIAPGGVADLMVAAGTLGVGWAMARRSLARPIRLVG